MLNVSVLGLFTSWPDGEPEAIAALTVRETTGRNVCAHPATPGADHHFDVLLLKYLAKHGPEFGASYVYPCVRHYQAHLSQSSEAERAVVAKLAPRGRSNKPLR